MSILPMKKVEIVAMRRDIDAILEVLGAEGCFQLVTEAKAIASSDDLSLTGNARASAAARPREHAESFERVQTIKRILGFDFPELVPAGARMPGPEDVQRLQGLWSKVAGFDADLSANQHRITRTREALAEAEAFAGLDLPWLSLEKLSFLSVRIGTVNPSVQADLATRLGGKGMIYPVDGKGMIVAATTRSGRFALDVELQKCGFTPKVFPEGFSGIPAELPATLEKELSSLEDRSIALEMRRRQLAGELQVEWQALAAVWTVADAVETLKAGLEGTEQTLRLEGWIPRSRIKDVAAKLAGVSGNRVALRTRMPREIESVRSGKEEVPILFQRIPFFKSFERMVVSYAVPHYGSIDPTPFVGTFFVFLFSIMFGDVGQGGLILLAGIGLQFGWMKPLRHWKKFAPIVIASGIGSMFMGVLTGSFFSNEAVLEPFEKFLTGHFLGHEEARFLDLLPGAETIGTIMVFFGFTLCIGVLINSLGLIFNIADTIKRGRVGHAIFQKTGLCGAFFLWWSIGMAIRVLVNSSFGLGWWDAVALGLPVVLLIFEEQLAGLIDGHVHHDDDGMFANVIKALVIVIETFSYYFSVTLSFLRVGAFALSHVVLSFVAFKMGSMVNDGSPLGFFLEALIVVLFNIIILVLEGMVVAIQVVRLQYYEFLSKFVTETGTLFAPFKFTFSKE
ncbi:MAG: V-type ATPase 116kDa subunit family protein [Spirochaetota bacterium]